MFMKKDIRHNIGEGFLFPLEEQGTIIAGLNSDEFIQSPKVSSPDSGLIGQELVKVEKIDRRRKPAIYEPRPDLTMGEMREFLMALKEIESVKGIRYVKLHVTAKMIIGIREASGKEFTINLDQLFNAYQKCLRFTSPEVKKYIFMGHSPAVVLLRMLQNRK